MSNQPTSEANEAELLGGDKPSETSNQNKKQEQGTCAGGGR